MRIRTLFVAALAGAVMLTAAADEARGRVFHDKNGNGVFDSGEPGVKGVAVSNGREVVETGGKGQYTLPVTDDTILFVIGTATSPSPAAGRPCRWEFFCRDIERSKAGYFR